MRRKRGIKVRIRKSGQRNSFSRIVSYIAFFLLVALWAVYLIRALDVKQVDDVNPLSDCPVEIMQKSDVYAVMPLYKNISIAENVSWCSEMRQLNKTLIMHGIYHNYKEFEENISVSDIKKAMEAFRECFGYYPKAFEAPQLAISWENEKMIKSLGMGLRGYPFTIFHKVYHCNNYGEQSNKFIDRF
jgi:hypothetical protein